MTIGDAPAMPAKLRFGATFSAAFSAVFGQIPMILKAAILPFVLSLLISGLGFYVITVVPDLSLPLQIIGYLPFAIFGIACSRLVLIGRGAGAIPRPLFGLRTLKYFGYTLLFTVIVALPAIIITVAVLGAAVFAFGQDLENPNTEVATQIAWLVPLMFIFYLVYMYFVTRVSLVFPAVATDQKLGLAGSWRMTRGSGLKLYLALVVITILSIAAVIIAGLIANSLAFFLMGGTDAFPNTIGEINWVAVALSAAPTVIFGLLSQYLGAALIIAAITFAYAQLSGWGGPREEVLQRFE